MRANKALQETIIYLSACVAVCNSLLDSEQAKLRPARGQLQTASDALMEVLAEAERGIDPDQIDHLSRQTRDIRLSVVHKADPQADRREVVVQEADIHWLADKALTGCWLCRKEGSDVKRCQMRKVLSRCGILIEAKIPGACPYQDWGA